ncbi:MAG: EAL domain-containing protein [Candidatus Izimaplasma sp.]|nr:EAL domain-containing protein [Candidatus Izimaplasma bacterium]
MKQLKVNRLLTVIFASFLVVMIVLRVVEFVLIKELSIVVNIGLFVYLIYLFRTLRRLSAHTAVLRNPYTQFKTKYELLSDHKKTRLPTHNMCAIHIDNYQDIIEVCGVSFVNVIDKNIKDRLLKIVDMTHIYEINDHTYFIMTSNTVEKEDILTVFELPMQGHKENDTYPLNVKVVTISDDIKESLELRNVLDLVDVAFYKLNNNKQSTFTIDQSLINDVNEENYYKGHLQQAIQKKEITTYFQPKLRKKDKIIVGAETLSRWLENERIVAPSKYIYIAEATGMIVDIDIISFEGSLQLLHTLKEQDLLTDHFKISTNFSPITLKNINIEDLQSKLDLYDINPSHISIEITERLAMDYDHIKPILDEIKTLGISIEMDDFSAGHASLSVLPLLGVDTVKIDYSVFPRKPFNQDEIAIYKGLVNLLDKLNLTIVSEGIETTDEYLLIHDLPVDLIQGYYISKPLPKTTFIDMLHNLEKHPNTD